MTNTENTTTQPQLIAVSRLERSPLNVRKTAAKAGLDEMKASILSHGLMQNLVVYEAGNGLFHVAAGGRRLEAIQSLIFDGKLPADFAVPCQVVSEDRALEMSLAEKTVRLPMHPADQFEAFAALIDQGLTAAEVAERFGIEESLVVKRMKLARVAPSLLKECREDKLTLECLMAFTITDDHAKQLQVHQSLQRWQLDDPAAIRSLLTEQMAEADSKMARFVGLDAYCAAGGQIRRDLFGDDVYLEDPELLNRLAGEKLEAARRELEAEGWKWIDVSPEQDWNVMHRCGRIHPQPVAAPQELLDRKAAVEAELKEITFAFDLGGDEDELYDRQDDAEARLSEIEYQLESSAAYDPDEMLQAGCYISIGQDGELCVDKGLVRREDLKRLAEDGDSRPAKPKGMPETLCRDLESYRLQAAQVEIARNRLVALDLLAFHVAQKALARRPVQGGPDVRFTAHDATPFVQQQRTAAADALTAIRERLPLAWLHQESEAERFQAFIALSDKEKLDFLAYGVAASLMPQLSTGREGTAYELALSLTDADLAAYWRPTRANYLGRITRDRLLALGRELLGEQWADARSRDKKGELADSLERAFAQPDKVPCTPERQQKLKQWLPEGMAFGATEPLPAETNLRVAA